MARSKGHSEECGAVMVELAIVAVLLVTLLFGGIELLRGIDAHAQMTDGARAGARAIAGYDLSLDGSSECDRHRAGEEAATRQMSRLLDAVGGVNIEILPDEIPVGYSMRPAVRVRVSMNGEGVFRMIGELLNVTEAESIFLIESGAPILECAKEN